MSQKAFLAKLIWLDKKAFSFEVVFNSFLFPVVVVIYLFTKAI